MRIVIHPCVAQRAGQHSLSGPWQWWRHRLRHCPDGNMYTVRYDPPATVQRPIAEEASVSFDLLHDYDIVDPPSMVMTTYLSELDGRWGDPTRSFVDGESTECDVVWHERPGDMWFELPGNTCEVGFYEMRSIQRNRDRGTLSTRNEWRMDMPPLRWPPPGIYEQISFMAQTPPALMPGPSFADQLDQIMEARSQYELRNRRSPRVIWMHPADYELLRRDARQRVDPLFQDLYRTSPDVERPYDNLYGLEVRIEPSLSRGQILITGDPNLEAQLQRPYLPPSILADYLGRERIEAAALAPRRDVLPEEELIDEIDRLVNESVSVGPVDDYTVNRFPKCDECHHDYHGLECAAVTRRDERCGCINTDWLDEGRQEEANG